MHLCICVCVCVCVCVCLCVECGGVFNLQFLVLSSQLGSQRCLHTLHQRLGMCRGKVHVSVYERGGGLCIYNVIGGFIPSLAYTFCELMTRNN